MLFYRKIYRTLVLNSSIISGQDFYRFSLLVFIPWWKIPASRCLNATQYLIWNVISKHSVANAELLHVYYQDTRWYYHSPCTQIIQASWMSYFPFAICPLWLHYCSSIYLLYLYISLHITLKITIAVYQSPMSFSDILKRPTKINQNSFVNK